MRHGVLYAAEEGYDHEFEAVVVGILGGVLERASPRERGWIAVRGGELDGERLGCLFVVEEPDEPSTCRLRLVLVEPRARGLGLGQRMLDEAIAWAREAGYRRMVLWTHESHRAAGRLYARNGFALLSATPARAFGQDVVDQTWARDL
jgi:GNAT superfamily N-acetyltransferase